MAIVKCSICGDGTSDSFPYCKTEKDKDLFVCSVCEGKFGRKDLIIERLKKLGHKKIKDSLNSKPEPFKYEITYEGGNRENKINMIWNIMEAESITLEELKEKER